MAAFAAAVVLLLPCVAQAVEKSYRYFRFTPLQLRNSPGQANSIQLSEFQFTLAGATLPMAGVTVTNPGGSNPGGEPPANIIDGQVSTKWLDFNKRGLVFDFGSTVTADGYNFATANDGEERDPLSWTVEGSANGDAWTLLHAVTNHPTTTARQVFETGFPFPGDMEPFISRFIGSPVVAINGQTVSLKHDVMLADKLTMVGIGEVTGTSTSVTPPPNADTEYLLDAENPYGIVSASTIVRTVAGGPATFRYVRFTPLKLRNGALANSIQLADFYFLNDATFVTPQSVTNPGGNSPGGEPPGNVIDSDPLTKWLDFNKRGLVFDFGSPVTFDRYSFTTANDGTERDPVRWTLEGSDDNSTWTLIENLNQFDFPVTNERRADIDDIPLPGASLIPLLNLITGDTRVPVGEKFVLNIASMAATAVTITEPAIGSVPLNGPVSLTITEDTFIDVTATNANGTEVSQTLFVTALDPSINTIAYQDFSNSGDELSLIGAAAVVTDPTRPLPGEVPRLRITPDAGSTNGTAWFRRRQHVADGFESTFDLHFTTTLGDGADGMAFVLHNDPATTLAAPPNNQEKGLPANSFNITFDSYRNADVGEPSSALLELRLGTNLLTSVNLAENPAFTFGGINADDLTTGPEATPYRVRVSYRPGDLDIDFNGVRVIDSFNLDLAASGAVDADGRAFAGFTARTGGAFEAHDVTRWFLTEGAPSGPAESIQLLGHHINFTTNRVSLTWASSDQKTYRVVASQDMELWDTVLQAGIPGAPGSTQTTVEPEFTPAPRLFFRVEEVPSP